MPPHIMSYRGSLRLRFKETAPKYSSQDHKIYEVGDRVGQIMILPYPTIEWNETNDFEDTERGSGGFGSSGK